MITVIHGRMCRDGRWWVPPVGDPEAVQALRASEKARQIKLELTKGTDQKRFHHVMLAFSCPYCGERHTGKGVSKVARTAKALAEEKLYGVDGETGELSGIGCQCGALYYRQDGTAAYQVNL